MISRAFCKRKHQHRSIACTRPRLMYCDGRKRDQHAHRTRSNDRPTRSIDRAIIARARGRRVRVRLTRESICSPPLPLARSPRSRPRARSDARDARSRFAPRARKRPPRRSRYVARARTRIDGTDRRGRRGRAWNARARDEMDGKGFVSSNAMGGSARARSAARDARDDDGGRWARSRAIDTRAYLGRG